MVAVVHREYCGKIRITFANPAEEPYALSIPKWRGSMFIVLLKFSSNKNQAGQFMAGHNEWIKRGFDDDVFLLVGTLQPNSGGGILAHNTTLADLQSRVNNDPFVAENVVTSQILEISPANADDRLRFLLD